MNKLPYLNLGCGSHFNNQWINIDFVKNGDKVIGHNLLEGIPFEDNTFEIVYHSHVLEHFSKNQAKQFIDNCYRILKPGGILRIVVPDLETIVKNYIRLIEMGKADPFDEKVRADYNWTMLEMYDQTVRNVSGGEMLKYLLKSDLLNEDFVVERWGHEAQMIRQSALKNYASPKSARSFLKTLTTLIKKLSSFYIYKNLLLKALFGNEYRLLEVAKFRASGEIHQWMYDFYSLSHLLMHTGFKIVERKEYNTSNITDWASFQLDEIDGKIRKPDSIFVEAIK